MNSQALEYHLTCNHYPPINGDFAHELAANAVKLVLEGKGAETVYATGGILRGKGAAISWPETPEQKVTASELVEKWHLEGFVEIEMAVAGHPFEDFAEIDGAGAGQTYDAQCINGHDWTVEPGNRLYARCKAREERGMLDALTVSGDECPDCQEEREVQEDREREDREFGLTGAGEGESNG